MIDIRLLRDKPDEVRAAYERLGATVDLAGVIAADARVRDLKNESQTMQAEQNRLSKEIGRAAAGEARERAKADSTALKEKIEKLNGELVAAEAGLDALLLELPNLPHPSVPVGKDESENVVLREEGQQAQLRLRAQAALGARRARSGIIDFERGVKISGSRFYVLQGLGRAAAARADRLDARPAHAASTATPRSTRPIMVKPRVPGRHRQPAQVRRQPVSRRGGGLLVDPDRRGAGHQPVPRRDPGRRARCRSTTSPTRPASAASRWRPAATCAASSAATSSTRSRWSSSCARRRRRTS